MGHQKGVWAGSKHHSRLRRSLLDWYIATINGGYHEGMLDEPSSSCLYHQLSIPFSEGICEIVLVVFLDQVVEPRLASKLVDPL